MTLKLPFRTLLLACFALPPTLAQVKTEVKPPATASDFSKEAYVLERVSTRISKESDGSGTKETAAEIKVLADAGVKAFAVLNFTYTSANEVVDIDYVRVRKSDGTVVQTPDYNIQDMPGQVTRIAPLYSDIHEKHVAVKGLGVGDVLEYSVKFRMVKPLVAGHFWEEYSFTRAAISKDERLEISVPGGKYVKIVSPEFKPEVSEEDGKKIYRWTHSNLIVKEKDPDEVPRRVPPNPDVQVTTFASWEDVGRWYGELQKEPVAVTLAIQAKAAELTKGLRTDDEKIHALYNFVSLKFHYIGLDFGIGRFQPHAADEVLDNGYGDCKDKHTLLASLLKAVGIEAWPVLIPSQRKLDPDVPSPAQFNHVITVVPEGDKFVWMDTTPEVAPYGLLLLMLRDKQALVIPSNKAPVLMTTPADPVLPMEQEFSMKGKLGTDGTFTGHSEQSYRGDTEVLLRTIFRQVSESQWKEAVQRFSNGMNFGGDVSNVKMTPPDDLDKPFELSYDYVRKNYGDWENRQITAPLPPVGVEVAKGAQDKKPEEPVLLGGLGKLSYRAQMELPKGYSVQAPAKCHLIESFAEYSSNTVVEKGIMTTTREMVVKKHEVPLSDWEKLREFGRAISDNEYNYIRLNGSSASAEAKADEVEEEDGETTKTADDLFRDATSALQRRDFERAQELFEKVIAKDPNYKGAHLNLGLTLGAQRNLTDALEEFRKEEKVAPENPTAYQALAAVLMQMNRRDDAIAEWRQLLKVDPENRTAASTLAAILSGAGKDSEAAEVLEAAVKAAPDSPSLQYQLGQAYLGAGQTEKAVPHLKEAVRQKGDDPMILNNIAYSLAEKKTNLDLARQYAEKALDNLDREAQDSMSSTDAGMRVTYQLSLVWDTLGWVYFQQGDFKRAESLVRPAWLLGVESVVAEHLGEIYEKEGKPQEAARAYQHALSVSSIPYSTMPMMQMDTMKAYRERTDDIKARYKKLTGKDPSLTEIRRLPNGQWTQTPAEQLRHTREVTISNEAKTSGSAQFVVVFQPGKVDSVEYFAGKDELRPLARKLEAAHYPLEFPPDSGAILVVRVDVKCESTSAPCVGTLVNPTADLALSPGLSALGP